MHKYLCVGPQMQPIGGHGETECVRDPHAGEPRRRARPELRMANLIGPNGVSKDSGFGTIKNNRAHGT